MASGVDSIGSKIGSKARWAGLAAGLRISRKLPLIIAAAALLSCAAVGTMSYIKASNTMRENAEVKLAALMELRKSTLTDYLATIRDDLDILSTNRMVLDALWAYQEAWRELGVNPTETLQRLYIRDNPYPAGEKDKLDMAADGSRYSRAHGRYHPWFRTFLRERGYYDVFLIDARGNLVYTVFKEADFATNLVTGKWKDSDLGRAFRAVRDNAKPGFHAFFDFKAYEPSNGVPASFIATPLFDDNGAFAGALAFQMPIGRINQVMQNAVGLGETGETYVVGDDLLMRSDSRFSKESTILARKVDTAPVREALSGKSGVMSAVDYRGLDVVSAYGPLEFLGTRWAVVAEIDTAEIYGHVVALRNSSILFSAVILVLVTGIGILAARGIVRPIVAMTGAMRALAAGDKQIDVPALGRKDEIGEMADAVQVFKQTAIEAERLAAAQAEEQAVREARARRIEELSAAFDQSASQVLGMVSSASTEMRSTAQSMTSTAEETSKQAGTVAGAAEEASANVQTVASAAEELSGSISEISRQVTQSTEIATQAVGEAEQVNGTVQNLAEAAQKIGEVVELISDIAGQTNLLALNATIEAARAGEAGKGFAVVASEVKSLANQTAKATEEIGAQIGQIQTATSATVTAIDSVRGIIDQMSANATTIAAAIEEQNAATQEIARNVQEVAGNTSEVSTNIDGVNQAASETGSAATQVLGAADELSRQAEVLRTEVERFLADLKAA